MNIYISPKSDLYRFLSILQLEGYDIQRYKRWLLRFRSNEPTQFTEKVKLAYTTKIKLILLVSALLCVLVPLFTLLLLTKIGYTFLAGFMFVILVFRPEITIMLATLLIKPFEYLVIQKIKLETSNKIGSLGNVKRIAIVGSYGKSSVKEILYQMLQREYRVLRTPESFNTLLGISKVVKYELDSTYDYFICEMGAFKRGEITALCDMVKPQVGIITGLTTQHIERFGSMRNIVKAKFEILDYLKDPRNLVFNLTNNHVTSEVHNRQLTNLFGYSLEKENGSDVWAEDVKFTGEGSSFTIHFSNDDYYNVSTPLFGSGNVLNILGASALAYKLGLQTSKIAGAINSLRQFHSRQAILKLNNATVVDNTFSSNLESFRQTVNTAERVVGKRVLVTPGIVEQGDSEADVHKQIANIIDGVFDQVILVGKTQRTLTLSNNLNPGNNVSFIEDTRKSYRQCIEELSRKYDWIFLENDLSQNY